MAYWTIFARKLKDGYSDRDWTVNYCKLVAQDRSVGYLVSSCSPASPPQGSSPSIEFIQIPWVCKEEKQKCSHLFQQNQGVVFNGVVSIK